MNIRFVFNRGVYNKKKLKKDKKKEHFNSFKSCQMPAVSAIFIRASHQAGFDTRSFFSMGIRGGGSHARVKLLVNIVIGSLGAL